MQPAPHNNKYPEELNSMPSILHETEFSGIIMSDGRGSLEQLKKKQDKLFRILYSYFSFLGLIGTQINKHSKLIQYYLYNLINH